MSADLLQHNAWVPAGMPVDKLSFSHRGEGFHEAPNEPLTAGALYKQSLAGYLELP